MIRRLLFLVPLFALALAACAVTSEHTTTNGVVSLTNTTSTAEWKPQALFVVFPAARTGTLTVTRTAGGVRVPLASHTFSNVSAVTWLPGADYPVRPGNVLAVSSSVPVLTLQIERNNYP